MGCARFCAGDRGRLCGSPDLRHRDHFAPVGALRLSRGDLVPAGLENRPRFSTLWQAEAGVPGQRGEHRLHGGALYRSAATRRTPIHRGTAPACARTARSRSIRKNVRPSIRTCRSSSAAWRLRCAGLPITITGRIR